MLAINKFLFFVDFLLLCNLLVCTIKVASRLRLHLFRDPHTATLFRPTVISNRWQLEDYSFLDCRTTAILFTSNSIIYQLEICAIGRRGFLYNASFLLPSGIYRVENVSSVREKGGKWNKQPFERGVRRRGPWPTRGQVEVPVDLGQAPGPLDEATLVNICEISSSER